VAKARILKHGGDPEGAARLADAARRLDLADRYLNCVAVKALFRAGHVSGCRAGGAGGQGRESATAGPPCSATVCSPLAAAPCPPLSCTSCCARPPPSAALATACADRAG
jgi:hypothetical protein